MGRCCSTVYERDIGSGPEVPGNFDLERQGGRSDLIGIEHDEEEMFDRLLHSIAGYRVFQRLWWRFRT